MTDTLLEAHMQRSRRRLRRALIPVALLSSATLVLAACGGNSASPGGDSSGSAGGSDKPVAVTLITKTATNPFFIAMQQGAEQAGTDKNGRFRSSSRKCSG